MLMRPSCGAATSVAARGRTSTVTLDLTAYSPAINVRTCRPAGSETCGEDWPRASSLPRQSTSRGNAERTLTVPSGTAGVGAAVAASGEAAGPAARVVPPAAGVAEEVGEAAAGGRAGDEERARMIATAAATTTTSAVATAIAASGRRAFVSARSTVGCIIVSGWTRVAAGRYVAPSGR